MNRKHVDEIYGGLVHNVLVRGQRKENRTGVDTISLFNYNYEIDLREGFPLLTTKEISWKNIVVENLWFLSGRTDVGFLQRHGCKFWDAWADASGQVPSAYGNFWRHFPTHGTVDSSDMATDGDPCLSYNDQVKWAIKELTRNPTTRRACISAWAPGNAQHSKLPPCHAFWVLNVQAERLNLHLTQRSGDVALGIPYNIAGYAFLLSLFSRFTGITPGVFAHSIVDAHIYTAKPDRSMREYDHIPCLELQLDREPRPLPNLVIDPSIKSLGDIDALIRRDPPTEELLEIFRLDGYNPHPAIKFKVAV